MFTNLGVIEYHKGNVEEAKKYFEKTLAINSNDEIAKENLKRLMDVTKVSV